MILLWRKYRCIRKKPKHKTNITECTIDTSPACLLMQRVLYKQRQKKARHSQTIVRLFGSRRGAEWLMPILSHGATRSICTGNSCCHLPCRSPLSCGTESGCLQNLGCRRHRRLPLLLRPASCSLAGSWNLQRSRKKGIKACQRSTSF